MLKRIFKLTLILFMAGALALSLPRMFTTLYARSRTYTLPAAPPRRAALVFGAGLYRDGSPTPVLRDRVATAAALFFAGKVEKLLMSGDNRFAYYNEPGAMLDYALRLGVPADAIVLDYAGRSTYDTCYRAHAIFGLKEAILVTQQFHLPRALYSCNLLGVNAVGVPADIQTYNLGRYLYWQGRETVATLNALWEVHLTHPLPVLGNPEPIFPLGAQ